MRKTLSLLTATLVALTIASCGGGGGGKSASEYYSNPAASSSGGGTTVSDSSYPTKGLTVTSTTTKAVSVTPSYLFTSGLLPKLVCADGVKDADEVTKTYAHFSGNTFNNCTLAFTDADGDVIWTSKNKITATSGSVVALGSDLALQPVSGHVKDDGVVDTDGDGVADECEGKRIENDQLTNSTLYDKTVILVWEADNMGDSSLTDYLKKNYNDLVSSLQNNQSNKVKFVVIWDGEKKDSIDGNTDVFILDPSSGKTFSVLDQDIQNVLDGDKVSNYYDDGILFWYGASDNLSNHLKELIEVAVRMFPAKSYDLIISDHGDGWTSLPTPTTRSVFFEHYTDPSGASGYTWLGTKQFVDTVLKPLSNEGVKFDLLGFDECLMGEFATLTLLQPYAKVFVVSPEYEQADGWGSVWSSLPSWYASTNDTWTIAKDVVDGYVSYYKQNPPNVPLAYPQTIGLTAVKSTALESLRTAFEKFAGDLYQTALNEKENGQMYEVFSSYFQNNATNTYQITLWVLNTSNYDHPDKTVETFESFYQKYFELYGNSGDGSDTSTLGYDLVGLVAGIGKSKALVDAGYTLNSGGFWTYSYTPYGSENCLLPNSPLILLKML